MSLFTWQGGQSRSDLSSDHVDLIPTAVFLFPNFESRHNVDPSSNAISHARRGPSSF